MKRHHKPIYIYSTFFTSGYEVEEGDEAFYEKLSDAKIDCVPADTMFRRQGGEIFKWRVNYKEPSIVDKWWYHLSLCRHAYFYNRRTKSWYRRKLTDKEMYVIAESAEVSYTYLQHGSSTQFIEHLNKVLPMYDRDIGNCTTIARLK